MTDIGSIAWFGSMREIGRMLPDEYVLHKPFEAVDASLWEFLTTQQEEEGEQTPSFKRHRITNGSARYSLFFPASNKQLVELANIYIRLVDERKTYVNITLRSVATTTSLEQKEGLEGFCKLELYTFSMWLKNDDKRIEALATVQPVHPPVDENGIPKIPLREMPETVRKTIQKQPGRPREEINEWARNQIQSGRDRADIFAEYLDRGDVDPSDEIEVEKARDRFRKALTRKEGNK